MMENILIPFSEKDLAAIKATKEYEEMKSVEYSAIVLEKVGVLITLMNSLHEEKAQVPSWQIWSEALIHKLSFHSVSLLKLFSGTEIPFKYNGSNVVVLDKPSIITLLRVVTENFLTYDYLYCNNISDEEKQFRLSVWRYCGIKQRTEFEITTEEARNKQIKEIQTLAVIKDEIINSLYFKKLKKNEQNIIMAGRKPRLFNSWINLIKESGLRINLYKNMYGYKSNYSHSEFISVLQVHSGNYIFNSNAEIEIELMLLHIIICKTIVKLNEMFQIVKNNYNKLDSKLIEEIEFINRFGSENYFANATKTAT